MNSAEVNTLWLKKLNEKRHREHKERLNKIQTRRPGSGCIGRA
jgi:hypothetical protein